MLPAARSASRSSSDRSRNSRSAPGVARVLVVSVMAAPRSSATSASSSADATRRGSRLQRRSARTRPPAPSTSATIGQRPHERAEPVARRLQQDASRRTGPRRPGGSRRRSRRRRMRAADVGPGRPGRRASRCPRPRAPWQSTQRSSAASRRVCAAERLVAAARPRPRTRARRRRAPPSTIHGNQRRIGYAVPCASRHHLVEDLRRSTGPNCDAGHHAVRADHVRLGLAAGPEVERGLRSRVERDRPRRRPRPST